jgi:transcriptional regulator with XRE-family HTH domain
MIKESLFVIIGRNLRRIRKEKGMSIERLSLISAVNKNYISDLERGNRNPTIGVLDRLAFALKIDIKDLF